LTNAQDANSFSNWQSGQIGGWFLTQLDSVKAAAGKEVTDYNARVRKMVDFVLDPANAALFATEGPIAAAGKAISGYVKAEGAKSVKAEVASWFEQKPLDYTTDTVWTTDSASWRFKAGKLLVDGNIVPVSNKVGRTWSGDPAVYEKQYGARFTTDDRSDDPKRRFLLVEEMSPAAQRAYAAWLQDPAVQQATWNEMSPVTMGRMGQTSVGVKPAG
jgi:hypothetical protein